MAEQTLLVEMTTGYRPALSTVETIWSKIRLNLEDIDRLATDPGTPRIVWGLDSLSYDKTIRAVVAPRNVSPRRRIESLATPIVGLTSGVESLNSQPRIPDYFTSTMLERIQDIKRTGDAGGVQAVSLEYANGSVSRTTISPTTTRHAREALAPSAKAISSIKGTLDVINIRGKDTRAQVYDPVARHAVQVIASHTEDAKIHGALGKQVVIGGELTRNAAGQPIRIMLSDFVISPDFEAEITAQDLLGADSGCTGDMSIEDWIDWVRGDRP